MTHNVKNYSFLDALPQNLRGEILDALTTKDNELAFKDNELAENKALIIHLQFLVKAYQEAKFGAKSEKSNKDQFKLAFEDIQIAIAATEAAQEKNNPQPKAKKPKKKSVRNLGNFSKDYPRTLRVIEPNTTVCGCGCQMHKIGEDLSERLTVVPAYFQVIVTKRPKYSCRLCLEGVTQAPAPEHLIPSGIPTEAMLADILIKKYADHLPLYRQEQIYKRMGINISRSTLSRWVGHMAFELKPVFKALVRHTKRSGKLFMDETIAPVLDPGKNKTKKGYLWVLARYDIPWTGDDDLYKNGGAPPAACYFYSPGRSGKYAEKFLKDWTGFLQVDGYAGYNRLTKPDRKEGAVTLVFCWAHARRKFVQLQKTMPSPLAEEAINMIGKLYSIEGEIKGLSPQKRLTVRQKLSAPIIEDLTNWAENTRQIVSRKSPVGIALNYMYQHLGGLSVFLKDGRVDLDNNAAERAIRPLVINRKNALFAGHDVGAENWGIIASLIETCKLNNINPHAYITKTLEALVNGHPQSKIDELLPWNFKP